jgi:predicted transcriptional regulator YdeE
MSLFSQIAYRTYLITAILFSAATAAISGEPAKMEAKVTQNAGFSVIGISARTSNATEMTTEGVIGKQWARLMQENLLSKIPNKADKNIIALYTDYASDKNGEYTYVLGAKVDSDTEIPAGMVMKKIPAGRYAIFTSDKGPAPKVVPELWMRINSLPSSAPGGNRVYGTDFEVYDERAADPQNIQMDVYVGIK